MNDDVDIWFQPVEYHIRTSTGIIGTLRRAVPGLRRRNEIILDAPIDKEQAEHLKTLCRCNQVDDMTVVFHNNSISAGKVY